MAPPPRSSPPMWNDCLRRRSPSFFPPCDLREAPRKRVAARSRRESPLPRGAGGSCEAGVSPPGAAQGGEEQTSTLPSAPWIGKGSLLIISQPGTPATNSRTRAAAAPGRSRRARPARCRRPRHRLRIAVDQRHEPGARRRRNRAPGKRLDEADEAEIGDDGADRLRDRPGVSSRLASRLLQHAEPGDRRGAVDAAGHGQHHGVTRAAPRSSRTSVKPPVEAPRSSATRPSGRGRRASMSAAASFKPPRETYGEAPGATDSSVSVASSIPASTRAPVDRHRPSLTRSAARLLVGASPRSTSSGRGAFFVDFVCAFHKVGPCFQIPSRAWRRGADGTRLYASAPLGARSRRSREPRSSAYLTDKCELKS